MLGLWTVRRTYYSDAGAVAVVSNQVIPYVYLSLRSRCSNFRLTTRLYARAFSGRVGGLLCFS